MYRNICIVSLCLAVLTACNPLPYIYEKIGWEDDNFVEEAAEFVIENRTGIDVDLTPATPESSTEIEVPLLSF